MKNSLFKFVVLATVTILYFSCSAEKEIPATLPLISTNNASNITLTAATSGGSISTDGGASVTARGVVWNTATAPTTNLPTKTSDGTGIGDFLSTLNNLSPATNYFARAYAINSVGTVYGREISFTTGAIVIVLPTLTTTAVSGITTNSALSGGTITNDGGGAVTARGIVWSTSQNPTISLTTKTSDGINTGTYTSNLTNLAPNTTYFIRSYATNSAGTNYGNELSFKTQNINYASMYRAETVFCNNVVTEVIDVINPLTGKTWMDRNLGASQTATSITDVLAYGDLYQWGRGADGHQCRNSPTTRVQSSTNQAINGFFIVEFYDWRNPPNDDLWQGVNGINNPCPNGYRLPTAAELSVNIVSLNLTFKIPLAGYRMTIGGDEVAILSAGKEGWYWTSTFEQGFSKRPRFLFFDIINKTENIAGWFRAAGLSVRCIKN